MASSSPQKPHPFTPKSQGDKAVDKTAHKTKLHSTYKGDKQWDGNICIYIRLYSCAHIYIMYMSGYITIAKYCTIYILLRTLYEAFSVSDALTL